MTIHTAESDVVAFGIDVFRLLNYYTLKNDNYEFDT